MKMFSIIAILFCATVTQAQLESGSERSNGFAIIGDAGKTNSNSKLVRDSIARFQVSHLILPGDNLYNSNYNSVWTPWASMGMSFDIVAIGNHNGGYSQEVAFFKMPAEYFSKVIDGARFIVLNSDSDSTGPEQAAWLDQTLSRSVEPITFLVYHHPTYTVSSFHTWQEKSKFQKALRPVLWKHRSKITALLVGHDHLASILHFNDLPVILSGAVQEVRKDTPVSNTQDGVKVQTAWYFDSTPHWAKLDWDVQSGSAQVQYIKASDDSISCTAVLRASQKAQLQSDCL